MKRYIIDASTAVKWYIPENLSTQAVLLLDLVKQSQAVLLAPDLILPEIGNTLWKKQTRSELSADETRIIVQSITEAFPARIISSTALLPGALEIATAYGRTVYDSLYIALAVAEEAPLLTADEHLANAMRGTGLADLVRYLGSFSEDSCQQSPEPTDR